MHKRNKVAGAAWVAIAALAGSVPALAEVDLAGQWGPLFHEDWQDRLPGPFLGDYSGIPVNDAARAKADAWGESVITLPERQCIPHQAPYTLHGPSNLRIWSETDPISTKRVAWRIIGPAGMDLTIWVDGRPQASKYAMHTWEGFTTGHWEGDTLVTFTDHMRIGELRRNGIPTSDYTTMTQHWMRHGNLLTITTIVYDPVYLTEPYIRTANWQLDPTQQTAVTPCEPVIEIVRPKGVVPHYLPGTNPSLDEVTKMYHIPFEALRGGPETMYPEYRKVLKPKFVPADKCVRYCCGYLAALPNAIPASLKCNEYGIPPSNQ